MFLSHGKVEREGLLLVLKTVSLEDLHDVFVRIGQSLHPCAECELIEYSLLKQHVFRVLEYQNDAPGYLSHALAFDRLAAETYITCCGLQQTVEMFYKRSLAGTVLTEDGSHAAFRNGYVYVSEALESVLEDLV